MISVTDLRSGTVFEDQGQVFQVLSYEHIKMGRGSANIKVRVKNVRTGAITDKSFINGAKVSDVRIIKKDLQFLYKDEDLAYFMDPKNFEQVSISLRKLTSDEYLKEGNTFSVSFLDKEAIALNLPPKMELSIVETGSSIRGNSASNIYKEAILENGIKTKVPLFLQVGDKVRIDTRDGSYTEKV